MLATVNVTNNKTPSNTVLKRFLENLPAKPYTTKGFEIEGLKIARKEQAIKNPYIQFNHPNWKKYIVLDIDIHGAVTEWLYEKSHLPAPNIIIENRENGKAHFVYELLDAVSFTEKSSLKAQNYYRAVEKSLTEAFEADHRYTGLIAKNPLSNRWRTSCFKEAPYHLKELASKLDLSLLNTSFYKKDSPINDHDIINGRNDETFHSVRHLAYTDIRQFKKEGGRLFEHWFKHVLGLVQAKNSCFIKPMDFNEIKHIAKSIANYCWKNNAICEQQFIDRQKSKGSKGGKAKSAKFEAVRIEAKKLFKKGISLKSIAEKLGISYRSAIRYTAGLIRLKVLSIKQLNSYRSAALNRKKVCDSSLNQVLAPKRVWLDIKEDFNKGLCWVYLNSTGNLLRLSLFKLKQNIRRRKINKIS